MRCWSEEPSHLERREALARSPFSALVSLPSRRHHWTEEQFSPEVNDRDRSRNQNWSTKHLKSTIQQSELSPKSKPIREQLLPTHNNKGNPHFDQFRWHSVQEDSDAPHLMIVLSYSNEFLEAAHEKKPRYAFWTSQGLWRRTSSLNLRI